jgi:hypothetical protein
MELLVWIHRTWIFTLSCLTGNPVVRTVYRGEGTEHYASPHHECVINHVGAAPGRNQASYIVQIEPSKKAEDVNTGLSR